VNPAMPAAPRAVRNAHRAARGFTYLGLLFLLAAMGLAAAGTVKLGHVQQRRMAEDELLFVGREFRRALQSYNEATPAGRVVTTPRSLNDLLRDTRHQPPKRHLRRIYPDPLTGRAEWALIQAHDGSLVGVHSLSDDTPIRMDNFPSEFFHFKNKTRYSEWVFVFGVECVDAGCKLPVPGRPTPALPGSPGGAR
jgi:type II secretory pathway pseudopilin PulG